MFVYNDFRQVVSFMVMYGVNLESFGVVVESCGETSCIIATLEYDNGIAVVVKFHIRENASFRGRTLGNPGNQLKFFCV